MPWAFHPTVFIDISKYAVCTWSTYIIRDFSPVLKAIGICDGSQQFRQLFYRFNNPDFRRGLFVLCIILFIVPDIYFNYIYTNHWFAVIGKKASLQRLNDLRVSQENKDKIFLVGYKWNKLIQNNNFITYLYINSIYNNHTSYVSFMFQNSLKHAYVRNQEFTKFTKLSHPIDDLYICPVNFSRHF